MKAKRRNGFVRTLVIAAALIVTHAVLLRVLAASGALEIMLTGGRQAPWHVLLLVVAFIAVRVSLILLLPARLLVAAWWAATRSGQ